jgi:triosephosphate isomerase
MRRPLIAGNWKLHKTVAETIELLKDLKRELADIGDRDIVVAPVFTALTRASEILAESNIDLAAQNCYPENSGAFTGEVSPLLLQDAGCRYVIVGHSERRQIFGETNEFINRKVQAVVARAMKVILCIGETLEERENEHTFHVLRSQLLEGLKDLKPADMADVVVAYEPVWAIGTGKTASNGQAQEAHGYIRGLLGETFGKETAAGIRILYGGSVKPDNVDGLLAQADIDGALVGGASLKANDFVRIVRFN